MKVMNKDSIIKSNAVKHTLSEKNILMRINNPFVVSLKYSFQTEDKLYMILDYINGGNFLGYILAYLNLR
jgi:serine/threonine protein kinase